MVEAYERVFFRLSTGAFTAQPSAFPLRMKTFTRLLSSLFLFSTALTHAAPILGKSGEGISFPATETPTDVNGAVGLNHFVQAVNSEYTVFGKAGNELENLSLNDLFTAGPCFDQFAGDPVVMYDKWNDRWIIAFIHIGVAVGDPSGLCFAISRTGDPVGGAAAYNSFLVPVIPVSITASLFSLLPQKKKKAKCTH